MIDRHFCGNIYLSISVFIWFTVFLHSNGLKIIHHRSNDVYWNGGDGRTSLWGLQNTRAATNSDEDDDLDLNQNSRSKLERSPFSVLNRASSANKSNQRQIKVYLKNTTVYTGDLVRLHCPYAHPEVSGASQPEEYFSTKTVIWTYELTSPKLLSNDADLFVKSSRFRLESVEPFVAPNDDLSKNDEYSTKRLIKRHYILAICPTKVHDTGWYSCTVVKKHMNDPSVKYYTYLNVLAADNNSDVYDETAVYDDYDDYTDFEQVCRDKEIVHAATSHFEKDGSNSSSIEFLSQEDSKNISLKRQIDNRLNSTTTKTILLNEINSGTNDSHLDELSGQESSLSIEEEVAAYGNNESRALEKISIHPRFLNQSEYSSFQLNCIYIGPKFENVKLVWLKNEKLLQTDDSAQQAQPSGQNPRRFFTLNYKQNFTNIGVLKFSHGLVQDTGKYKCVALHESDTMRMSLNDTSFLIVNKNPHGTDGSLSRLSSNSDREYLNNGQSPSISLNNSIFILFSFWFIILI